MRRMNGSRVLMASGSILIALCAVHASTAAAAEWNPAVFSKEDTLKIRTTGPTEGEYWSPVWLVVLDSAIGGLIVAVVVKYADNILKGYATSVSIILSSVFSVLFLSFMPSFVWVLGTLGVLASTVLYGMPDPQPLRLPV